MVDQNKSFYYFNKTRGSLLAREACIADTFLLRAVGLLKTANLAAGQGLHIVPCRQIHMFGMKYAIDVIFLDRKGKVVGLCKNILPGQMSASFSQAHSCLELPVGVIEASLTAAGDEIESALSPCPYKS